MNSPLSFADSCREIELRKQIANLKLEIARTFGKRDAINDALRERGTKLSRLQSELAMIIAPPEQALPMQKCG